MPPRTSTPTPKRRNAVLALAALAAAGLIAWVAFSHTAADPAIGKNALQQVSEIVAFGPRPVGSEAHLKTERVIIDKLKAAGIPVEEDHFMATAPAGPVTMNNIVGRIAGNTSRTIILATHYDTKLEHNFQFLGANDGGSGTGLLLALAPILAKRKLNHSVWLVFLDGEEAFGEWTATDSLYGSRHFADQLKHTINLSQFGAFILLDMIGDADLGVLKDSNSTPWLRDLVWNTAKRLGYSRYFLDSGSAMEDDHIPMLQSGIPSVDLIDFDYGRGNSYWHSAGDTVDKLSAQSLQVIGDVVLETITELDRQ